MAIIHVPPTKILDGIALEERGERVHLLDVVGCGQRKRCINFIQGV